MHPLHVLWSGPSLLIIPVGGLVLGVYFCPESLVTLWSFVSVYLPGISTWIPKYLKLGSSKEQLTAFPPKHCLLRPFPQTFPHLRNWQLHPSSCWASNCQSGPWFLSLLPQISHTRWCIFSVKPSKYISNWSSHKLPCSSLAQVTSASWILTTMVP